MKWIKYSNVKKKLYQHAPVNSSAQIKKVAEKKNEENKNMKNKNYESQRIMYVFIQWMLDNYEPIKCKSRGLGYEFWLWKNKDENANDELHTSEELFDCYLG